MRDFWRKENRPQRGKGEKKARRAFNGLPWKGKVGQGKKDQRKKTEPGCD